MGLTKDEIQAKKRVADARAALSVALAEEAKVSAWQKNFGQPTCPFCGHHRDNHSVGIRRPRLLIPRRGRKTGVPFLNPEYLSPHETIVGAKCETCGTDYSTRSTLCYLRPDGNSEVVNRRGVSEEELQIAVEKFQAGYDGPTWLSSQAEAP